MTLPTQPLLTFARSRVSQAVAAVGSSTLPSASRLQTPAASGSTSRQLRTARAHRLYSSSTRTRAAEAQDALYSSSQSLRPPPSASTSTSTSSSASSLPALSSDASLVRVTWPSGIESRFHHIWLRDHCRCAECFHPKTKQRLMNTFEIPPNVQPLAVEPTTEGLQVLWPTQRAASTSSEDDPSPPALEAADATASAPSQETAPHASLYPWHWLRINSYAPPLGQHHSSSLTYQEDLAGPNKTLWGSGIAAHPPTVAYEEVMADDAGVYKWLSKIDQYGFSFVSGVPPTPEATEELIRRIAFIRETHYGGFWDFTSDLSHGDTAYTDLALGAHTDTTYFTDPAGLQLFHLLSHEPSASTGEAAKGGASLLVDGFLAAKVLKDVYPESYELLSTIRISTHSAGDESTFIRPLIKSGYPILSHDPQSGKLIMVRYNNDDRSTLSFKHLPDESMVQPFYTALGHWHSILTSTSGEYWQQLTPGNALIFDNHRVLHGRSAFVGQRRLCGAYVNHDDYRSRFDTLKKRYGQSGSGSASTKNEDQPSMRGVWDDGL